MTVARICQRDVDTAAPDENAFQAAERMHQRTVGALIVMDGDRVPVGIITDRDLMIRVIGAGRDPYTTTLRSIMTAWPKTVSSGTPIEMALSLMRSGAFRRLPVVDESGHLEGIVTLDDILVLLSEEMSQVGRLLEEETPQAAALPTSRPR